MPLYIVLPNGIAISADQIACMAEIQRKHGDMRWHPNECGCCVTVHTKDGSYVVHETGEHDFFPEPS